MKLRVLVNPSLYLTKEKKTVSYNDVFEVDEKRGSEILRATYQNKPVVELVEEKETLIQKKKKGEMKDE